MNLQKIDEAFGRLRFCPKCNSTQGFWMGIIKDHPFFQCKDCGTKFELFEVFRIRETGKKPEWLKFFRK